MTRTGLLGYIPKADDLCKIALTCGLVIHIAAYQTLFFKLSDYWFWVTNDTAIVFYFLFSYFAAVKLGKYIRFIANVGLSFSIAALAEDIIGSGGSYHIRQYIFALLTFILCFWEYRKKL